MARTLEKPNTVVETSTAQIAVHWREEEYYYPSAKFIGQANLSDPDVNERFSEKNFPECFREYADLLDWDQYWAHHARHQRSAVLEVVRRRQDQCLVQLRGPAPRQVQEQSCDHLCSGTGVRSARIRHLPRAVCESERIRGVAARFLRVEGRRSRHHSYADGTRVADYHAGMCSAWASIHSVVFGGFSGEACGMRAADSGSQVLITMDGYYRNGKLLDHKAGADIALNIAKQEGQDRGQGPGLEASRGPECVRCALRGRA